MSMVRRDVEAGGRRRKSRDALTSRPEIERLLDAARAPASPRELAGEQAAVAVFAAAHRRAASPSPSRGRRSRVRMFRSPRMVVVNTAVRPLDTVIVVYPVDDWFRSSRTVSVIRYEPLWEYVC